MPSHPLVPRFALTCYMLSGHEIVVENVTRDTLVGQVSRKLATVLLLDNELAQVLLVSGMNMMPQFDTFQDWGISEVSNMPVVNIVVTGSQAKLSRELHDWHEQMECLRRQWADAVVTRKQYAEMLTYT
jgi:hypothetical protein